MGGRRHSAMRFRDDLATTSFAFTQLEDPIPRLVFHIGIAGTRRPDRADCMKGRLRHFGSVLVLAVGMSEVRPLLAVEHREIARIHFKGSKTYCRTKSSQLPPETLPTR